MLASQINWKSGGRILSLALLGGITLSSGVGEYPLAAHAAPTAEQSWLAFEGPWLCRTWTSVQVSVQASAQVVVPAFPTVAPGGATSTAPAPGATATQSVEPVRQGAAQFGDGWFGISPTSQGGTVHCTLRWHISKDLRLISDQPDWVPNPTGEWPLADDLLAREPHQRPARRATPQPAVATAQQRVRPSQSSRPAPQPVRTAAPNPAPAPAPVTGGAPSAWSPVPGHPTYGMSDFAGDPWSAYYGVCTWYAWYRHQNEPLMRLGSAANWIANARAAGLSVGSSPVAGATVVFQPGVEGAGGGGHAAHVEQVLGGGWFVLSEMNFYWNGGGWGRVDWRYAYVAPGVSFIY